MSLAFTSVLDLMRILIVSQYFWPESFIINDLAKSLADAGHQVTVATGKPNYPSGRLAPGYRRRGVQREIFSERVEVIRIPLRPRGAPGAIGLSLNYLSFVLSGLLRLPFLLKGEAFDAIVVFCISPITAAIPAIVLKKQKQAHLALWIQDLWPESVAATGFVHNRGILGAVRSIVKLIYAAADTLLVQSEAFVDPVARNGDRRKIVFFPNFAPTDVGSRPRPLPATVTRQLHEHFCVVFAGNLGKAQSLETIVSAARLLRDNGDIRILIAGTGSQALWLERAVREEELKNIVLLGELEADLMPELFAGAEALLVTLRRNDTLGATVPSKIQAYLKAGRPIIGALDGEGARLIKLAGAGMAVPAEDAEGLASAILTLQQMSSIARADLGSAATALFEARFDGSRAGERLVEILRTRMAKGSGG